MCSFWSNWPKTALAQVIWLNRRWIQGLDKKFYMDIITYPSPIADSDLPSKRSNENIFISFWETHREPFNTHENVFFKVLN